MVRPPNDQLGTTKFTSRPLLCIQLSLCYVTWPLSLGGHTEGATLNHHHPSQLGGARPISKICSDLPSLLAEVLSQLEELRVVVEGACFGNQVHILQYCLDAAGKLSVSTETLHSHLLAVACRGLMWFTYILYHFFFIQSSRPSWLWVYCIYNITCWCQPWRGSYIYNDKNSRGTEKMITSIIWQIGH